MANTIALAEKFLPILEEVYKQSSLTSFMDAMTKPVEFSGASEVKVFKISMVGLGDYSRTDGYPTGDVTGAWETISLSHERGRQFSVDRMDNEESLGMAFGQLAGEFIRTQVVPEVDAIRFAEYASGTGVQVVGTPATLSTASAVLSAIDVGAQALDDNEVPSEGRVLFISSALHRLLNASVTRSLVNQQQLERRLKVLDDMQIIPVPQSRFYDSVTLNAGATSSAGGFTKTATTGADLNFLLMHPTAGDQATKMALPKIFDPDTNQSADAWLFQYRMYHDAWVYENKCKGIYVHKKAAG